MKLIIKHFRINNFNSLSTIERNLIKERIKNSFSSNNKFDNDYAKELFQYFDWSERQSKFIINSVRVYDFFNFDWALPFWDLEIVNFWRKNTFFTKERQISV